MVVGVIGAVLTPLMIDWIQKRTPKISAYQYYLTVDKKSVPTQIGLLNLDYKAQNTPNQLVLEVINEGNAPESDLRVQANFSQSLTVTFTEEPDLRIYQAEEVSLVQNRFFMNLKHFPIAAHAQVAFLIEGPADLLCKNQVKVVGHEMEGRVEGIRGISCP